MQQELKLESITGVPVSKPFSCLLEGPPGIGKSTLAIQTAGEELLKGRACVFVTTSAPVSKLLSYFPNEKPAFIDVYSWRLGEKEEKTDYPAVSLQEMNQLIFVFEKTLKEQGKPGVVILDSASDFFLYNEETSAFKFMELFLRKAKENNFFTVVIIEKPLHSKKQVSFLEYLTDMVIELEFENDKRKMRVLKDIAPHKLEWNFFEIKNSKLYTLTT